MAFLDSSNLGIQTQKRHQRRNEKKRRDKAPSRKNLSSEILMYILTYLDEPSTICFALTSHLNYDLVVETSKVARLRELCPPAARYYQTPNTFDILMGRLSHWMPAKHRWCRWTRMEHISNLNYGAQTVSRICSDSYWGC